MTINLHWLYETNCEVDFSLELQKKLVCICIVFSDNILLFLMWILHFGGLGSLKQNSHTWDTKFNELFTFSRNSTAIGILSSLVFCIYISKMVK